MLISKIEAEQRLFIEPLLKVMKTVLFYSEMRIFKIPSLSFCLLQIDHKDVIELLLKNGADVNVKNNEQWTPLHAASYFGYLDVVQLLLDRRADVNAKNNYGNGPIHLASDAGKLNFRTKRNCFFQKIKYSLKFEFAGFDKVVEKLISHKADVNLTNNQGWNALIWAVFSS